MKEDLVYIRVPYLQHIIEEAGAHIRGGVGGCDTPPCFVKYIKKVGPET